MSRECPAPRPRQLALGFAHPESFAREDFVAGPPNAAALALVESWPDWPSRTVAVVGPRGAGKSHLAAIWAERSGARFLAGRSLDLAAVPQALATGALVLEDVAAEQTPPQPAALFHLLNLARETGAYVLITALTPPATWTVGLPDLRSRLRAIPTASMAHPDDALLRAVLVKLFADRQLAVDQGLLDYLVARMERSFAAARRVVIELDREALRRQRPITRALALELLRDG